MTILKILVAPDPRLKQAAEPVAEINAEILTELSDMAETMYEFNGVGLAATQVGIMKRMIVMDGANPSEGEAPRLIKFINPEIIEMSEDDLNEIEEGCLSVPGYFEKLHRPNVCKVKYTDETGAEQTKTFKNLESTCIQHEIEHLNGVLFIDHISRVRRGMITKKLQKLKKAGTVFHRGKSKHDQNM